MTRRGQWYDFTTKDGRCQMAQGNCGCPKTHVVKWARPGREGRLRHFVCAGHAEIMVVHQQAMGNDVRAYRYRKG